MMITVGPALSTTHVLWGEDDKLVVGKLPGKRGRALRGAGEMTHVALAEGRAFAAGDFAGVAAWDVHTGARRWRVEGNDEEGVYVLVASRGGELVVTGGEDRVARAYDGESGALRWELATDKMVWSAAIAGDGAVVAIADWAGGIWIVEASSGRVARRFSIGGMPNALAFAAGGLVVGRGHPEERGEVAEALALVDIATGKQRVYEGYTHGIAGVVARTDGFVVASYDGTVRVHRGDRVELAHHDFDVPVALAADDDRILVRTERGALVQLG